MMRKRKVTNSSSSSLSPKLSAKLMNNGINPKSLIFMLLGACTTILFITTIIFYLKTSSLTLTVDDLTSKLVTLTQHNKESSGIKNTDKLPLNMDNNIDKLRSMIQKQDMLWLQLKYGNLLKNNQNIIINIDTNVGNIKLEMAPINMMPHAVRYFVEMVESGFWNGCAFFRNANHVIQANCHHRNPRNEYNPSIMFQEYNTNIEYLHKPQSIGIAGRPGGPDFYVNLLDNIRSHGPGGQGPEPDPCFGRVIKGWDVIEKIHKMEHDGSAMQVLKEWVTFNSVSIDKEYYNNNNINNEHDIPK